MFIQWPLIIFAYLTLLSFGLIDNLRGPYYPQILDDLQLSNTKGALFFSITSLAAFLTSFSLRPVLKRFGSTKVLRISMLVFALGSWLIAQSPDFSRLLLSCVILGIGFGSVGLSQNQAVGEASNLSARRRLLSGLHSMYGLSSLLAPLLAAYLMDLGWTWRNAFAAIALAPAIVSLGSVIVKDPQHILQQKWQETVELGSARNHSLYVAFMIGLYVAAEILLSSRLPLYAVRELGLSQQEGSYMLAWFFGGLLFGRLLFMFMHFKRLSEIHILYASALLTCFGFVVGVFWDVRALMWCGLFMAPFYPVALEYLIQVFGRRSPGALAHAIGMGSFAVLFMHYLVGVSIDAYGMKPTMLAGPILMGVAALMLWARPRIFTSPVDALA